MYNSGGLSASDVALMSNNGRRDDDEFMWIFALLLLGNGGIGWGNNRGGNPVTEADLCNANSFNELKSQVGRLNDQVANVNTNLGNAICSLGYETLRNFNNLENIISRCCCETQRQIDSVNYNVSQQASETRATVVAQVQRVLDQLCADKTAAMQNRINQLELNQALCGVVRYPNQTTFNAGAAPFWNNQCGNC